MPAQELEDVKSVRIGPSSIAQAQSILYNAYLDHELMQHLLDAHKPGFKQRLRSLIREDILAHFTSTNISIALVSDTRLVGCAIVERASDPLDFYSNWRWKLAMYSTVGIFRTERLHRYYEAVHDKLDNIDHYWITHIGVHPELRGHGYGRQLMEAIHAECERDPDYHGISVDLSGDNLVHFFENAGYRKVGEIPVDDIHSQLYFHPRNGEEFPSAAEHASS